VLIKYASPYDFSFPDKQLVTVLEPGLTKSAGIDVSDIKYEPDTMKIHVIALGAGEYWGANRNGDYFPEKALQDYHETFVKFGNFHKNHKNKPHDPKFGWVEKSWYNPKMHRVELIVVVDLLKYPEFKDLIDSGKEIPVSMAAKLPFDICSICGHRRTKPGRENTCRHVNDELTKVLPDGRQVYAINTRPKFFDISKVWKPADRTAYVLRKVASADMEMEKYASPYLNTQENFDGFRKSGWKKNENGTWTRLNSKTAALDEELNNAGRDPFLAISKTSHLTKKAYVEPHLRKQAWDKIAFIQKLSELEKRIEGELAGKVEDGKVKAIKNGISKVDLPDEVLDSMSQLPKSTAYASLADKGIILRPKEFLRLNMGPKAPPADSLMPLIRGIFSKLSRRDDLEQHWPSSDFDLGGCPEHSRVSRVFSRFIEPRSILREPAVKRTIMIVMVNGPKKPELSVDKKELEKESSFNQALATIYGLYKASALKYILDSNGETNLTTNNVPAVSAILENYL
jgi:hypothetical protein